MTIGTGRCCVNCQTYLYAKQNGVLVLETMDDCVSPYKIWRADLFACPDCGYELISGFAQEPISEHFMPDFQQLLGHVTHTIKGCPRRYPKE